MFDSSAIKDTYNGRNTATSGYTYILEYNDFLRSYITKVNQKISAISPYFESYTDNLHITLLGLDPAAAFMNNAEDIITTLNAFTAIHLQGLFLKVEKNGSVVLELTVDEPSQVSLTAHRRRLEQHQIFYKHQAHITKLHSVIGLLNYNAVKNMSTLELDALFNKINHVLRLENHREIKISAIEGALDTPRIVKYATTDLHGYTIIKNIADV